MKKTFVLIALIFILGIVLRFYQLGDVPVGLHRDEAFLGYNAYSILKTGKDMSGVFLPLHFESFLYSPAGYSYFSIPFIGLFGLNAFSVRFASALFGSLTVLTMYFLTKELFQRFKNFKLLTFHFSLGEIAALFFAISPWHINLSRTATENVLVVFFISLGTLLFFLWLRKSYWYLLILSFLSFVLTLFLYQAPRAFLPFFILLLVFFAAKKVARHQIFIIIFLFFATIIIPLFLILVSNNLSLRIRTVSVFSSEETKLALNQFIREDGVQQIPVFISRVFHNKVTGYANQVIENYFKHFSYDFLFADKGFPDRYRVPMMGLLYFFEIPFLIVGISYILSKERDIGLFLIGWILIAPIGSALTFDDIPNLQRMLIVFPALSIIIAFGASYSFLLLKNNRLIFKLLLPIIALLMFYNIFFYLHQYYIHWKVYRPWYRHDGYKELVAKVNALLPSYKKAIVTDRESAPTIFFLFYGKYNPSQFQQVAYNSQLRDFDRISFNNYVFTQEECPLRFDPKTQTFTGEKNVLYVNSSLCKEQEGIKILETIKRSDNSEVFHIVVLE